MEPTFNKHIKSILEFLKSENVKLDPLPKLILSKDINESKNPLGATGYYDPATNEIIIYTEGRHNKDILRSFVHELMHHNQNLRLSNLNVGTENINKSVFLEKIEADAYMRGNLYFRKWENKFKGTK